MCSPRLTSSSPLAPLYSPCSPAVGCAAPGYCQASMCMPVAPPPPAPVYAPPPPVYAPPVPAPVYAPPVPVPAPVAVPAFAPPPACAPACGP